MKRFHNNNYNEDVSCQHVQDTAKQYYGEIHDIASLQQERRKISNKPSKTYVKI